MAKEKKEPQIVEVEKVGITDSAILLSEAEYTRRTLLSVSDSEYINPSLGHYKIG